MPPSLVPPWPRAQHQPCGVWVVVEVLPPVVVPPVVEARPVVGRPARMLPAALLVPRMLLRGALVRALEPGLAVVLLVGLRQVARVLLVLLVPLVVLSAWLQVRRWMLHRRVSRPSRVPPSPRWLIPLARPQVLPPARGRTPRRCHPPHPLPDQEVRWSTHRQSSMTPLVRQGAGRQVGE